ncbi:nitroreductase family protein [Prauserella oleivorans]|uniref:Nitroreductase family protein n=1 Tax=Prauserella oleivorans TaxID=1478153 RepID=A0ABW5W7T5_9PSEU
MDIAERLRALIARRSRRHFTDEPVSEADVERIVEIARFTGSARNRQPWRFVAVTDPRTRAALASLGAYAQHLAAAPLVLVLLAHDNTYRDTEFDVGRVSQSLTLAASALGFGTCLATFYPDENVRRAAELLRVTGPWLPRHALSVGRPAPPPADQLGSPAIPTGRLPVSELLSWHRR